MFKFNRMFVRFLLGCLLLSNVGFAQQQNPSEYPILEDWHEFPLVGQTDSSTVHVILPDSLPKFNPDESGFITKAGCKIIPTKYYCFSDGRYYFAVGDTNYFYIDTSEVLTHQNIDLGKDQRFSTKKRVGFARRFWLGTVIVGGPVMVAVGAGGFFLFGATVVTPPDQFDFDGGGFFVGGLAISTTIFYYVLQSAISNVREYKAYKAAQLYVCL